MNNSFKGTFSTSAILDNGIGVLRFLSEQVCKLLVGQPTLFHYIFYP